MNSNDDKRIRSEGSLDMQEFCRQYGQEHNLDPKQQAVMEALLRPDPREEERIGKQRQDQRRKGRRKKRRNILIVVLLLIVGCTVAGNIARITKRKKALSDSGMTLELMGLQLPSEEEYLEWMKNEPSDLAGKSRYEKHEMGLFIEDGSDSDYDGLTDKEEIEIYGSDPLKASTAGDLYKDGYKVAHDMALFSFYEYAEEISFQNNECVEVLLEADIPSDLNAVVKDYTDRYSAEEVGVETIYKGYWLYNYSGNLQIDIADLLEEHKMNNSDIQVLIAEGAFVAAGVTEFETCKFDSAGTTIALNFEFKRDRQYFVYITEKPGMMDSLVSVVGDMFGSASGGSLENSSEGTAMVYGSPLLWHLFKKGLHIRYSRLDSEESTQSHANRVVNYYNITLELEKPVSVDDEKIVKSSTGRSISNKYKLFQRLLPWCEGAAYNAETDIKWLKLLFIYAPYDAVQAQALENDGKENKSGFDKYTDELPFGNFGSYINTGGNCAGLSHLTAYLYNTGSLPASGSYVCTVDGKEQEITWDLGSDKENKTLMDAGLADYKTASFVEEHSENNDNVVDAGLSVGEEQFVNMVGCYWAEGNRKNDYNTYVKRDGEKNEYRLIKRLMKYLDKGKAADVYLYFFGLNGHAVNIYDYKKISDDEIWFYVYDNNIPQDNAFLVDDACYLKVKKEVQDDGSRTFDFLYAPLGENDPRYFATSYHMIMPTSMIVLMDENWNIID